ncbi:DcaP family trimeric outer membrane transporter [Halomonas shantousis]
MRQYNNLAVGSIFSVSVMALAIAGSANAFELKAGDTDVRIGGYAKLDMIYDVDDDMGNAVKHSAISLDGENHSEGHTNLHAYQSRIGFQTATPVGDSVLKTNIEGDFYGSGNNFRLRHAYGEWNGLLAGQTWTNFSGAVGLTPTVDFTGVGGTAHTARQPQLRYTTGGFSVALEDPDTLGRTLSVNDSSSEEAKSGLPDLTLRYGASTGMLKYSASAVLRQLEYYNQVTDDEESAFGWGASLAAEAQLTDIFTLRGVVTHGDGIGGYLNVSAYDTQPGAPAYIDASGDLETVKGTGGTVGMSLKAGPGAVNLSYSIAAVDLDDLYDTGGIDPHTDETYESIYLNYIWSPVERITYGIEAGLHSREVVNGEEGDAVRLQGMVMYSF